MIMFEKYSNLILLIFHNPGMLKYNDEKIIFNLKVDCDVISITSLRCIYKISCGLLYGVEHVTNLEERLVMKKYRFLHYQLHWNLIFCWSFVHLCWKNIYSGNQCMPWVWFKDVVCFLEWLINVIYLSPALFVDEVCPLTVAIVWKCTIILKLIDYI